MEKSVQSSHSTWMAHWTRRSCGERACNFNQPSDIFGKKVNGHHTSGHQSTCMLEIATPNICSPPKGLKNIESRTCKEDDGLRMTLISMRNKQLGCQSFYKDGPGRIAGISKALKGNQAAFNVSAMQSQNDQEIDNTSAGGLLTDSEARLQINNDPPIKALTLFGDGSHPKSSPLAEEDPHNVQSGLDNSCRRATLFPLVRDKPASAPKEQLPPTNPWQSKCEYFNCNRRSSFWACEEKAGVLSKSERSMAACFQETIASPLQADPSTSNNRLSAFGKHFQKIWNFSGPRHFPNLSKLSHNSLEKLDHGFDTHAKFQSSVNEVETTRICTTLNSVVGVSGGHSRFSQTTHSLLITEKTDFNLFKTDQTYRNSRGRSDFGMRPFSNLITTPRPFGHVKDGVKLRSLHGFTDPKVQEKSKGVYVLNKFASGDEKNMEDTSDLEDPVDRKGKKVVNDWGSDFDVDSESSAETDIMDLGNFKGVTSSPPVKVISSTTPRLALASKLPDMNLELPTSAAKEGMLDHEEPSTSRTQSLDIETVLAHTDQVSPLESVNGLGGSLNPEPGGRWLKRLKLSASTSHSVGTKCSNFEEKSPHKRNNLSLERVLNGSKASSEPQPSRNHDKELVVPGESTSCPRGEASCADLVKKERDLLLSQSWIRRWCHNQEATPEKNPNAEVITQPHCSKSLLDIKKKQFPSIAAMALMAKAIGGLQPCDIQNKGAVVVWST